MQYVNFTLLNSDQINYPLPAMSLASYSPSFIQSGYPQEQLTSLIIQNKQLLGQKKQSYQQKIIRYQQKVQSLTKYLNQLQDEEDTQQQQESKQVIEVKIEEIETKMQEYQNRIDQLEQIQCEMHDYIRQDQRGNAPQDRGNIVNFNRSNKRQNFTYTSVNKFKTQQAHSSLIQYDTKSLNIFNTPNSKPFNTSKVQNQHQRNHAKSQFGQRVPLGQLLTKNQNLTSQNQKRWLKKDNPKNQTHIIQTLDDDKQTRTRARSVPMIYPFGKSEAKVRIQSQINQKNQKQKRRKSSYVQNYHTQIQGNQNEIEKNQKQIQRKRNQFEHISFQRDAFKKTHNYQSPQTMVISEYICQLSQLIEQVFTKYPHILQNSQVHRNNVKFEQNIRKKSQHQLQPLEQSLHIILSYIQSHEQKFKDYRSETEKQKKVLKQISQQRTSIKNLEYQKISLEEEIQKFQFKVQELISKQRNLLNSIDHLEQLKASIHEQLKGEIVKVRQELLSSRDDSLSTKISHFHLKDNKRCKNTFTQSTEQSIFEQISRQLKITKQQLCQFVVQNNSMLNQINSNKHKLQGGLEKIKAQFQMMKIKKQHMQGQLNEQHQSQTYILKELSSHQSTIDNLKLNIYNLETSKQTLESSIEHMSSIIQTKKESIKSLDETMEKKKTKKKQLFEMIDKMEKVLEQADKEKAQLEQKIKEIKQQIEMSQRQKTSLIKHHQQARRQNQTLRNQAQKLLQQFSGRQRQVETLEKAINGKNKEHCSLQEQALIKRQLIRAAQKHLQELNSQQIAFQKQIQQKNQHLSQVNANCHRSVEALNVIQSKMQEITSLLNESSQVQLSKQNQIRSLQKQVSLMQQKLLEAQQNYEHHNTQTTQKQRQLQQVINRTEQTESTKQQLEGLLMQILEQKQMYIRELEQKYNELVKIQHKVKQRQTIKQELDAQIKEMQTQADKLTDMVEQFQRALEDLQERLTQSKEEQSDVVCRLKILKKLQLKKCITIGLKLSHNLQPIDEDEEKLITQRIQQVVQELQQYQSSCKQANTKILSNASKGCKKTVAFKQ